MSSSLSSNRTKGISALFACSAIYASFGPLVRVLAEMFGVYAQVAARMGLAFIFLFLLTLIFRRFRVLSRSQIKKAILLGVVSTSIIVFFTIAITEIKIASTIFLLYTASILSSIILGTSLFREHLTKQKIAGIVLALAGLYFFVASSLSLALTFGVIAAILSGLSEGLANAIRKWLKDADRVMVTLIQFLTITVCASVVSLVSLEPVVHAISLSAVIALICFALLQLALNYLLLYGFQNFDVNIGTVILSLELFFAAILGFVFFHEVMTPNELLGGLLIFLASVVSAWEFKQGESA